MSPTVKVLLVIGGALLLVGVFLHFGSGRFFGWFGHLPGDVRVERPGARVYFPWVSMLVVSVLVNLLLWLWRRFS